MQRRGERLRAFVPSLQMQWEYQVCPSGLLDGVAIAFAKETLRTLQNGFQIHEAILSEYATDATYTCPRPACSHPYREECHDMATVLSGGYSLAGVSPIHHPTSMEAAFLVQ